MEKESQMKFKQTPYYHALYAAYDRAVADGILSSNPLEPPCDEPTPLPEQEESNKGIDPATSTGEAEP